MRFERITEAEYPYFKEAMELYEISFPRHEQRELASQSEILGNPEYHFDIVFDEDVFVGEILYWNIGDALSRRIPTHTFIRHTTRKTPGIRWW